MNTDLFSRSSTVDTLTDLQTSRLSKCQLAETITCPKSPIHHFHPFPSVST